MANEITITLSGTLKNGNLQDAFGPFSQQINQITQGETAPVIALTTTDTAVSLGSVVTPGYVFIRNLDSTNYIQFGCTNGGAIDVLGKLLPGEFACFRMDPGAALRMKANTATCNVQVKIWSA